MLFSSVQKKYVTKSGSADDRSIAVVTHPQPGPITALLPGVDGYILIASDHHNLIDVGIAKLTVGQAGSQAQILQFSMACLGLNLLYVDCSVDELEVFEQGMRAGQ